MMKNIERLIVVSCLLLVTFLSAQPPAFGEMEPVASRPLNGNRPGWTRESFSKLFSSCGICDYECRSSKRPWCVSWTCFHPLGLSSAEPARNFPVTCHLKEDLSPLSPPIGQITPLPGTPRGGSGTSGNGARDDMCYTSSQNIRPLPLRPERPTRTARGIYSVAQPNPPRNAVILGELAEENRLLGMIQDYKSSVRGVDRPMEVLPECWGHAVPPTPPAREDEKMTREQCIEKYCPMCAGATLFEKPFPGSECDKCLKANSAKIDRCVREGTRKTLLKAMEWDTNRIGKDYKNFDLPEPNPELCRNACASDPKCKACTYVKPGYQTPTSGTGQKARCWLKYDVPPSTSDTCCHSWVK